MNFTYYISKQAMRQAAPVANQISLLTCRGKYGSFNKRNALTGSFVYDVPHREHALGGSMQELFSIVALEQVS